MVSDKSASYMISDLDGGAGDRAFRDSLAQFPTGVAVITALGDEDRPAGLTVNSFTSLSLDPPLILWCLDRASNCADLFAPGGSFAVNILGAGQEALAHRFAKEAADRFSGIGLIGGGDGPPLIDGAVAILECAVAAAEEGGDHLIIVGRVTRCRTRAGPALVFHRGRYRSSE